MKPVFMFFVFSFLTLAAQADVLRCQSYNKVNGWIAADTYDYVNFSAHVESETVLRNPQITGAYWAGLDNNKGAISLDNPEKTNQYPRYRFEPLEDAWHWFFLMLPKNYLQIESPFNASLQMYREEVHTPEYIGMNCFLKKTKRPEVEIM